MLEKLLKDTKLKKEVKRIFDENEGILDIILFGSVVRGKQHPEDLDILLLFSRKIEDKTIQKLESILKKTEYNFELTTATYADLFSTSFLPRDTIFDGISLISGKKISEGFGYKTFVLFKYSLKGFTNSQRVRFFYSLKGRYGKGLLKEMGYRFGKDSFIIFSDKVEEFKKFLESWKVDYKELEALIPERRENIL